MATMNKLLFSLLTIKLQTLKTPITAPPEKPQPPATPPMQDLSECAICIPLTLKTVSAAGVFAMCVVLLPVIIYPFQQPGIRQA